MKKLSLLSLGLMSFSAVVLGAAPVFAAEGDPIVAKSEGTVLFDVDTETEPPTTPPTVDPESPDPGGTIDPGTPGEKPTPEKPEGKPGTGTDGTKPGAGANQSFNITYVSNFRFNAKKADGTAWEPIKLDSNGMTLFAYGTDLVLDRENHPDEQLNYEKIPNLVEVTDNRGNKNAGWELSVTRTDFKSVNGDVLTGSELSLNNAKAGGPVDVTAPTIFNGADSVVIPTDGSAVVMEAAKGTGTGTWALSFGQEAADWTTVEGISGAPVQYKQLAVDADGVPTTGVKLEVPAKAQAQAGVLYTSDITWTLASTPKA